MYVEHGFFEWIEQKGGWFTYQHIYHKQGRFYQTPNEFNEQLRSGSEYFNPKVKTSLYVVVDIKCFDSKDFTASCSRFFSWIYYPGAKRVILHQLSYPKADYCDSAGCFFELSIQVHFFNFVIFVLFLHYHWTFFTRRNSSHLSPADCGDGRKTGWRNLTTI